jgi:hypothetical protein
MPKIHFQSIQAVAISIDCRSVPVDEIVNAFFYRCEDTTHGVLDPTDNPQTFILCGECYRRVTDSCFAIRRVFLLSVKCSSCGEKR